MQALLGKPIPGGYTPKPKQPWSVIPVEVSLQKVANLANESAQQNLGTSAPELTGDWNGYRQRSATTSVVGPTGLAPTQQLGQALHDSPRIEAFLTVSAQAPCCHNLVIFPKKLFYGSKVTFTDPDTGRRDEVVGRRRRIP